MNLDRTGVYASAPGSLNSCLVEGDPEQERRARRGKLRAVLFSIVAQVLSLAALVVFPLLSKGEARSLFRSAKDNVIEPINHWFRANEFLWGRTYVYTTDRTARTSSGDYELWVFPIEISAAK